MHDSNDRTVCPVTAAALREHLEYSAWASHRLVTAAAKLPSEDLTRDLGTADRSVLGTLAHILAADRVWLSRLARTPYPGFVTDADRNLTVLQTDWPPLHERWIAWVQGLTDESAQAVLDYTDLKGKEWRQPVWQLVLHVVNHATHHRGQVSGFLRSMGHTPPAVDLIYYYRELAAAAG